MSKRLFEQRCANHADREAAARCLECGRFFCRECVTEHRGRLLCAACLGRTARPPLRRRLHLAWVGRAAALVAAFFFAWVFFYSLGRNLARIPVAVHEGTVWWKK